MAEAGFAAAALVVEGETACRVATHAGGGEGGENFADFVEDLHIGRRCGAGGLADGGLVHFEHGAEWFEAGDAFVEVRVERGAFAGEDIANGWNDDSPDERAFSRA